jgi:tartrate dehydrogenase/decarboxylase / D-malate dehydrogenase
MKTYRIAVIPGDGIGLEVVPAAIEAIDAAASRCGFGIRWAHLPWGSQHYVDHGRMMPEDGIARLRTSDAIFLGAVGDPRLQDHVTLNGLLLPIRRAFDQYACVRPAVLHAGVRCPLAGKQPGDIDFVVVRENTEGRVRAGGRRPVSRRAARRGAADGGLHAARDRAHHPVRLRSGALAAASGC